MREKKARVWWVYRHLLCAWTNFDFLASSSAKNEAMGNQTQNKNPISGRKKKRGSEVGEEGGSGCYQRDQGKVWWWEFRWWRIQPRRANSASILSWRKQAMDRTVSFFLHFSLSLYVFFSLSFSTQLRDLIRWYLWLFLFVPLLPYPQTQWAMLGPIQYLSSSNGLNIEGDWLIICFPLLN